MKATPAALTIAALVAGCAFNPRMNYDDLNTFKIDCSKKYEQIAFLESQLPTQNERFGAALTRGLITELPAHFRGEKSEHSRLVDGDYGFVIRFQISALERHCPDARVVRQ